MSTAFPPHALRRRILVVDDNADAAQAMALLLEMMGHEVDAAHNGRDALATAVDHPPDLVLLDLGMPEMDGYETARRLRAEPACAHARLVALTGWDQDDARAQVEGAAFDRHLIKPVGADALEEILAELERPSKQDPPRSESTA